MKLSPVKVRNIYKTLKEVKDEREAPVNIVLAGSAEAEKEALARRLASGLTYGDDLRFLELTEDRLPAELPLEVLTSDVVLLIADERACFSQATAFTIAKLQQMRKPYLVVVEKVEEISDSSGLVERLFKALGVPPDRMTFVSLRADVGIDGELVPRIARAMDDKEVALAARFPVFRGAAADKVIRETSLQNALLATISLFPGADMPVLSANQTRMVIRLAAIYGQDLTMTRVREILGVLGGGIAFRAIARQLLDLLPGFGRVIKGTVAHGGTVALGKACKRYFEVLSSESEESAAKI